MGLMTGCKAYHEANHKFSHQDNLRSSKIIPIKLSSKMSWIFPPESHHGNVHHYPEWTTPDSKPNKKGL